MARRRSRISPRNVLGRLEELMCPKCGGELRQGHFKVNDGTFVENARACHPCNRIWDLDAVRRAVLGSS